MSLRNPLLSGPSHTSGPGQIKNPLLSSGSLSSKGSLGLGLSSSGTKSSLLTTSSSALSSSLFSSSILTKVRPTTAATTKLEQDEARINKAKKEAMQLKRQLGGEQVSSSLRSDLLLSSSGAHHGIQSSALSGGLLGRTSMNLTNPLLTNPLLNSSSLTPTVRHEKAHTAAQPRVKSAPKVMVDHSTKKVRTQVPPPKARDAKQVKVAKNIKTKSMGRASQKSHRAEYRTELDVPHQNQAIDMPEYRLDAGRPPNQERIIFESQELSTELDNACKVDAGLVDIEGIKRALLNGVAGSLIRAPDFKQKQDAVRLDLIAMATRTAEYEPEFVLKVALYTRNELNIRATANFLLAFASNNAKCRPHLRRYFGTSIRLPSDWIDVAEQYQVFDDRSIKFGALPAALRRSMTAKFPDFDKYQLAKYNKDSSKSKKKKKEKESGAVRGRGRGGPRGRGGYGRGRGRDDRGRRDWTRDYPRLRRESVSSSSSSASSSEDEDETPEPEKKKKKKFSWSDDSDSDAEIERKTFTLKQLIRKLHIVEPVEHVMCLIGKRYPSTLEAFYQSRLPGTWEEERADKRMKLPTPETWETQVSLKGNKATTWQDLIDHKKLPFMAMLRNLRNMIKAGISEKHHNWVIRKLTDERAVASSRQFPFRFFSAYEVLTELENDYEKNQSDIVSTAVEMTSGVGRGCSPPLRRGRGARGGRGRGGRGGKTSSALPAEVQYDKQILQRYRKALDTAVKIATVHNVTPIPGTTVILVNLSTEMGRPCTSAKGLGKPRLLSEVGVLLGLMCKYSCEECRMMVYGAKTDENSPEQCHTVDLEKGTILDNMDSVLELQKVMYTYNDNGANVPKAQLDELLRDRIQVDNLIVLSRGIDEGTSEDVMMKSFLDKYRRLVNPGLLFVNVDLGGRMPSVTKRAGHENDVHIAGFSDQILRFVAERGSAAQLVHVEKIDEAYNLKPQPQLASETKVQPTQSVVNPEKPLPVPALTPSWRTARVFISSTFRDMHGERDLLTRFVFPELRARAQPHFINVYEVDLRWGVTEKQTRDNMALQLCLSEVARSHLFVGILGERYGWVPDQSTIPDEPQFDWVREYPDGASVTELEMYLAALNKPMDAQDRAFFYFRDNAFEQDVPKRWRDDFMAEDSVCQRKMRQLKDRLRSSGLEVMDGYPCHWGGVVNKVQPIVAGLDNFGFRVLNNLWGALQKSFPDEASVLDEHAHTNALHEAFIKSRQERFVGRAKLIKKSLTTLLEMGSGMLALVGKSGSGKTAFMAELMRQYVNKAGSGLGVLAHFIGAAPGSTHVVPLLRRLCHEMRRRFDLSTTVPDEYKNLVLVFTEMLTAAATRAGSRFVLVLEGLDLLEDAHQARTLEWLPETIPQNCVLLVSVTEGTDVHKALIRRKPQTVSVGPLELLEKADVVRHTLSLHRKALDESAFNNQMKLLTSKKEANVPLYLNLACDVLRSFGVFEKFTERIKTLPQTVPTLLQEVLQQLEEDYGNDVTSTALSLLVCARNGLDETALHHLVSVSCDLRLDRSLDKDDVVCVARNMSPKELLPIATFSRLLRAIRGFMRPTSDKGTAVLAVENADVHRAIQQRYMTSPDTVIALHKLLAGYYHSCADVNGDGSWVGTNMTAFADLPYHMVQAGTYDWLEGTLCNLHFLYAKCQLGLGVSALEDFHIEGVVNKSAEKERAQFAASKKVAAFRSFIVRNIHILKNHPGLLWQQAVNDPGESAVRTAGCQALKNMPKKPKILEWLNRPKHTDPCTRTFSGLCHVVTAVAFSPDDRMFVCGSADGSARVYVANTGREHLVLTGHSNKVTGVTFAGTARICTASADNTLCLWDSNDGHRVNVMKFHKRPVSAVTSDPTGKVIVSTGWDCQIVVWEASSGKKVGGESIRAESCPAGCVAFHPEDEVIATGWWDATIRIYNIFHRKRLGILRGHSTSVRDVAYNPSGRHIASASLDGEVKLWSSIHGTLVGNLHCHSLPINQLTFAPSGHELVTVSDDGQVKVWSGHLGRPGGPLTAAGGSGPVSCVVFCPGGQQLAVGYHRGHVKVFDTNSGTLDFEVHPHTKRVRCIAVHDNYLISGSDDATVAVTSLTSQKVVTHLTGHTKAVLSVATCPFMAATTSEDGTVCLYHMVDALTLEKEDSIAASQVLTGHVGPVTGCTFNPDNTRLATCGRDKSVRIWNLSALKKEPWVLNDCHADWVNAVAWSGKFLVTASNDFNLKVWDAATGVEKFKLVGHTAAVTHVAYQHGCIVSTCTDGTVKVWSHRGTEITTLHGHKQCVNAAAIYVKIKLKDSSSGRGSDSWADITDEEDWKQRHSEAKLSKSDVKLDDFIVAACSEDGTVRMWQPLEGNQLACLTGHSDRVVAVACARDGTILSASRDLSVKTWQPTLEEMSGTLSHNAEVTCILVLPETPMFLTASRDGTIILWETTASGLPVIRSTVQAHEKSVNCMCYLEKRNESLLFVTGSDDGVIKSWLIVKTKDGVAVRTGHVVNAVDKKKTPITSLTTRATTDRRKRMILATTWTGVTVYHIQGNTARNQEDLEYGDMLLASHLLQDFHLAGATDGNLQLTQLQGDSVMDQSIVCVTPAEVTNMDVTNWVTAVTTARGAYWTGDSDGQLSRGDLDSSDLKQHKVHQGAVRGLASMDKELITSGADAAVRVWGTDDVKLAGQFFGVSPVTCVAAMTYHGQPRIIAGDVLGNVSVLNWLR